LDYPPGQFAVVAFAASDDGAATAASASRALISKRQAASTTVKHKRGGGEIGKGEREREKSERKPIPLTMMEELGENGAIFLLFCLTGRPYMNVRSVQCIIR
jgi:hypothetical protein